MGRIRTTLVGLVIGALSGALIGACTLWFAALLSDRSGFLGSSRQWAPVAAVFGLVYGGIAGVLIGIIVGMTQASRNLATGVGAAVGAFWAGSWFGGQGWRDSETFFNGLAYIVACAVIGRVTARATGAPPGAAVYPWDRWFAPGRVRLLLIGMLAGALSGALFGALVLGSTALLVTPTTMYGIVQPPLPVAISIGVRYGAISGALIGGIVGLTGATRYLAAWVGAGFGAFLAGYLLTNQRWQIDPEVVRSLACVVAGAAVGWLSARAVNRR